MSSPTTSSSTRATAARSSRPTRPGRAALEGVDVLIDGPYERGLDDGRGIRGSANQRVWRLSANAGDFDYEGAERATQSFVFDDVVFMAGLT